MRAQDPMLGTYSKRSANVVPTGMKIFAAGIYIHRFRCLKIYTNSISTETYQWQHDDEHADENEAISSSDRVNKQGYDNCISSQWQNIPTAIVSER
jgi:hypothetical protein